MSLKPMLSLQQVFQVLSLMLEEEAKPQEPFGFRRAKRN